MMDFRHAGCGWANGPVNNAKILALPSQDILLLSSEHWHHDEAVRAGKRVLFRGMARQGWRPAEVGWNARRYVDEITRDAVRVSEPITDFVAWNELNLGPDERGDNWPDHGDLTDLYSLLGQFMLGVISDLRQRPSTRSARLHFGAWAPKDETDYIDHWRAAAEAVDVLDVHAYGPGPGIIGHIEKYRALFPGNPINLTEWHSDLAGPEEDRRTLELLANYSVNIPDFRAYYFAWRWDGAPAHQQDLAEAIAIDGNAGRLALFQHPPIAAVDPPVDPPPPDPPEEPPPVYRVPTWTPAYIDIRDGAIQVADEYGMSKRRLLGLCLAECGFGLQSFDRWASTERSQRMTAAITAQDWATVQVIFSEIVGTPTNDLSWGPCHQTWYWSDEYPGDRSPGDPHRHNLQEIMEFRARYIEDHGMALRVAASTLVRLAAAHGQDDQTVLERYNKPNGVVSAGVRANYQRSLVEADRILAELGQATAPVPVPTPSTIAYEDFRDPEPAGRFARTPKGIILHGSRSGIAGRPKDAEYLGTARYEVSNTAGLGWNITCGEGKLAVHLTPQEWGWNARAASDDYLAVEIAQATVDEPVSDAQVDALADWIKTCVLPAWPDLPMHFPSHAEVEGTGETGQVDGKSDVFPRGDARMDELRGRLMARLAAVPIDPPPPPPPPDPLPARLTREELVAGLTTIRAEIDALLTRA